LYCYTIHQQDYQIQRLGPLSLAVGQVQLTSTVTRERTDLSFAVLHLGGWDFHCCIQTFRRRLAYQRAKEAVFAAMAQASAAQTMVAISREFGDRAYSLQDLLPEERHRIMQWLSQGTLQRLDQLYTQVYRDNYGLLRAFHRDGIAVPQELQVALEVLHTLDQETSDPDCNPLRLGEDALNELAAIATEASYFQANLSLPEAKPMLERADLAFGVAGAQSTHWRYPHRRCRLVGALNLPGGWVVAGAFPGAPSGTVLPAPEP
jgi:hypothetical protein